MAISTAALTSTLSVTRTQQQYQPLPVQQAQPKTEARKQQEAPSLNLSAGTNDLGQPNVDGTGASFSILV